MSEEILDFKKKHDLRFVIPATSKRYKGSHYVVDVCPFHKDTKPSLYISAMYYKCMACGEKGDIFDYTKTAFGWDFNKTISSTELPIAEVNEAELKTATTIKEWPSIIGVQYHFNCSPNVVNFYTWKGFKKQTVIAFKLGFGFPPHYFNGDEKPDRSLARFTIPLLENDKLYGIKFRRNDCCPKCWNPDTSVEKHDDEEFGYCSLCNDGWLIDDKKFTSLDGQKTILWGLSDIPDDYHDALCICEGEWDRMTLWQHGFHAVTSTTGALSFNKNMTKAINKHGFRRVFILYDNDMAGEKGAEHITNLFKDSDTIVTVVNFPEAKDVTDLARNIGNFSKLFDKQDRLKS